MIQVRGLTKRYRRSGTPAIEDVSFDVRNGEILGFVGLNGAGKTTTIRVASGVSLPTGGSVTVDGHDISGDKVAASMALGWVPEFPNFEPSAKALTQMRYYSGFYRIPSGESRRRCLEALKMVGLEGHERERLRTYSQGMKKRFSLAAALLPDPQNFVFDEILNGLDPQGIQWLRDWMVEKRNDGHAIMLSSHILSEVQLIADRIVFLHHGHVVRTMDRADLTKDLRGSLRVTIENLDEGALELLRPFGELRREGPSTVVVVGRTSEAADINFALTERKYRVAELRPDESNLEALFFETIGEAK
ncbi:MAG: ABC transporter ATP-binding protein [Thermoplasmata archaeon]